ncbi:two-component system sensor histidine kinase NtrB [Cohnella hashimotonis]|uniref:histidine kinase n=1 Tax=Cohnella hashimotonis TaxID=2826895 RepID=A0ABT6TJZ0_9BACL|nr:ATP-binding protein [Cohnella hashimotonis]MDI4647162.1 ATP-binding protein [Cohnella hashimotonis]
MEKWRTRYFPVLVEYVLHEDTREGYDLSELLDLLNGVPAEHIFEQHEENVRLLVSHADSEDRLALMHRSLLFLHEILGSHTCSESAAAKEEHLPEDLIQAAAKAIPLQEERPSRFETVLQHLDSGIALFEPGGTLRFLNVPMARLLQAPRRILIGQSLRQLLFHPSLSRSLRLIFIRMYRQLKYDRRAQGEFQDGSRYLLISISQIEELDGDILVSIKDVSEHKQIEQSAFQNDKLAMLGKIAAAIAHEIRNPLTSIRGFIQLLKPYLESIGKQEYARIILSEIDRANDIIYEFLNSSKPSAPMTQTVLVGLLLKETILLTESEAHMQGVEMTCEIFDPYLTISIDVKQIKQVILNMVKNALDAVAHVAEKRRPNIRLSARKERGYAVISIADNGRGMDRETLSRLFDPFFTTKFEGTGLGLSVSYRIIRNHGGTVQVDSRLGEGTEFMIYLPFVGEKE